MNTSDLSRRTVLIAGTAAAALAWLVRPEAGSAVEAAPAAVAAERPHRTLLGVL